MTMQTIFRTTKRKVIGTVWVHVYEDEAGRVNYKSFDHRGRRNSIASNPRWGRPLYRINVRPKASGGVWHA